MKKIVYIIAALAALAVSCQKESFAPASSDEYSEILEGRIVFSTSLPKTALNGSQPVWAEGDSVKILWAKETQVLDSTTMSMKDTTILGSVLAPVNPSTGEIVAVVDTARDFYYAVYPHWATSTLIVTPDASDSLTVTVRSTSADGSWGNAQFAVAITDANSAHFSFKNISNALKFTVTTPGVTSVKITTPNSAATAAKARFAFNGEEPGDPRYVTPQISSTVTVDGPGTYYAPIVYGAEWASGFTIAEFVGEDLVCFATTENPVFWSRNYIMDAGTIEDHKFVPRDYYFKPAACGKEDGSSWDNAAGPDKLCSLLSREDGNWYIDGQNLFLSKGTYDLSIDGSSVGFTFKNVTSFNLKGGYPEDATGTDTTGRDIEANKTLLQTSATCSSARMFYSSSGCKFGKVVFDGLYFGEQSVAVNTRGWVLYINAGCGFPEDYSSVTFNDCVFQNLVSGTGYHYGMADVNCSNATVNFKDCTFKGIETTNPSKGGAAIVVEGCKTVNIDNCLFEDHKSKGNGAAISLLFTDSGKTAKNTVNITSSNFKNNSVTDQLSLYECGCGGAIYVLGVKDAAFNNEVNISGCTFEGNYAKSTAGAISYRYNLDLNITDCTFKNNSCDGYYNTNSTGGNQGGGAIANVASKTSSSPGTFTSNGTTRITNCVFESNSGKRGGAIHFSATTMYIDGCTFESNRSGGNGGGAIFKLAGSLYVSRSKFISNSTKTSGGGALGLKSTTGAAYFADCLFQANSCDATSSPMVVANFNSSNAKTGVDANFFGCTFFGNGEGTTFSSESLGTGSFTNCTFAEANTSSTYVIKNAGTDTHTLLNNVILSGAGYSLGSAGSIASAGTNIYGTASGVTVNLASGAGADLSGATLSGVFGAEPALNTDGKLEWSGSIEGITSLSAEAVKTSLQAIKPEMYNWLEEKGLWFSGETWIPGAWQN